jgi:hypothetical protein
MRRFIVLSCEKMAGGIFAHVGWQKPGAPPEISAPASWRTRQTGYSANIVRFLVSTA